MILRRSIYGVAALAVSILLGACASTGTGAAEQGGGGGGARGEGVPPSMAMPVNPAVIALAHAGELGLADGQRTTLEAIRRGIDSANAPLRMQLDSLRPTQRPVNPRDMSQEQRDQMRARRAAIGAVVSQMRGNTAAARGRVFAALSPEQQRKLEEWEKEARERAEAEGTRAGRMMGDGMEGGRRPAGVGVGGPYVRG